MRPVLHGDITCAARAVLAVPENARHEICLSLIRRAEIADAHCRATGQVHFFWGNGSLMAAARTRPLPPEPTFDDSDYCTCVEMVLRNLVEWRISQTHS